ncbi:MAG: phosphatase PAP2 family protein [bacterium]|nr:phosphatase PAP2 family protein [bacterium]
MGDDANKTSIGSGSGVARELDLVGGRREFRIAGVTIAGRRRRPSGEAAPLPRNLHRAGQLWLLSGLMMVVIWISLFLIPTSTEWWSVQDHKLLTRLVDIRTDALTTVAKAFNSLTSELFIRVLRVVTVLSLIFVKRWRHFFAVLITLAITQGTGELVQDWVGRPRPLVPILVDWKGASHPSLPVGGLAVTFGVMAYSLLPASRWRRGVLAGSGVLMFVIALSRIYLGVDHPSDAWVSLLFAPAVAVVVFRLFAPEAVFPVSWRRGVTAHLDVSGRRGDAIRKAVRDQLGIEVVGIELFGAEGSGGSTPIRLELAPDDTHGEDYLFGKLYSQTHLRSDRWYKVGRTILYGALEDEMRFSSVRRLVEYEDYIQRLMRDCGIPSAEPFGIVEITPDREYLMISQFLFGSEELTDAEVDVDLIDDALGVIRQMWDAGLAHRDIKPANVMVRDNKVVLIDVAFGTVRPSPWRQAVDLANMMVILALRSNAELVYERALLQFDPYDIAEAFAATRSVTLPSQSRSSLALFKREHGVDIVEEFRRLAPEAEPISIQRWSARRIGLTLVAAALAIVILGTIVSEVSGQGLL